MIEMRLVLLLVALSSQWVMATVLLALLLDPNVCAVCALVLLGADADLALHRLRDEQRWSAYQREMVRAYEGVDTQPVNRGEDERYVP